MKKIIRLSRVLLFLTGVFLMFSILQAGIPGDFDTSFSGDGFDAVRVGSQSHEGNAIAIQSDGKIVVAGDQQNNLILLRYRPNGTLDSTFGGGDGIVVANLSGPDEQATDMAIQPDGKIIIIGTSDEAKLIMARYNPNGTLDTTFATNGKYAKSVLPGGFTLSGGIALLPSGKFIVCGSFFDDARNQYDFFIARFNANGKIDKTFGGGDGIVLTDFADEWDFGRDIVRQSDGKLVVVGGANVGAFTALAVVRYNANGTLDTTFGGGDGKFNAGVASYGAKVKALSGGKLLIGGNVNNDFLLVQMLENGDPDPAFGGGDGVATHNFGATSDSLIDLARLPGGNIVAVGRASDATENIAIARFTGAGVLDLSFSEDGQILLTQGETYNSGNAVAIQPDGKIIFTGRMEMSGDTYIYTARLHNETLRNADFEQNKNGDTLPDYWKGKSLSNDTLVCNNPGIPAFSGDCAFRMRGDTDGKRERLTQDFNVAGFGGDEFTLTAYIESNNLPADSAKISIEFRSGSALINKGSASVVNLNSDGYVLLSDNLTALGIYDRVRVTIELQATTGQMLVDSLTLTQTGFASLTLPTSADSAPLRLPN